jgi:hypothetical protein
MIVELLFDVMAVRAPSVEVELAPPASTTTPPSIEAATILSMPYMARHEAALLGYTSYNRYAIRSVAVKPTLSKI